MPGERMQQVWQGGGNFSRTGNESSTGNSTSTRHPHLSGARSQDDATVGYGFQRPQTDFSHDYMAKRWMTGDDSVLEQLQVRGMVNAAELERGVQSLHIGTDGRQRKGWEVEKSHTGGAGADGGNKAIFASDNLWASREESWHSSASDHAISTPISVAHRRPGSFPGSEPNMVLSPRSSDTGVLGVNMAEYVLGGGSPVAKDLDSRLVHKRYVREGDKKAGDSAMKEGVFTDVKSELREAEQQPIQNGLEEENFRANGAVGLQESDTARLNAPKPEDLLEVRTQPIVQPTFALESQFEPVAVDPFQLDYTGQLVPPVGMDSPNNFAADYTQQIFRQQPTLALLNQQQYAVPQQQMGMATYAPAPYYLNASDPYAVGIQMAAGPTIVPQYYGMQAPWAVYPNTGILQQAQQNSQLPLMRGQLSRPLTPSQQPQELLTGLAPPLQGTPTPGPGTPGTPATPYQILTPAYYDQSGQLMVGNGRGMATPVRLISPAPMLVNTQQSQQSYTPGAGNMYQSANTGIYNPGLGYAPQQAAYPNGPPTPTFALAPGLTSQRRDSFGSVDMKRPMQPYYTSLGSPSPVGSLGFMPPGASLTPPAPQLNNPGNGLAFPGFGASAAALRFSAAPGAEAKIRAGALAPGLYGPQFVNPKLFGKNAMMPKEVSGRSRLLEDFRNNRIQNLQLKDIVNHVIEFAQDQHGSRFIQQKLERVSVAEKQMVFAEILTAAYSLMTDVFGNYVIQKFFEFGTPDQKQTLAQRIRGHVLSLALQMYGCRVIQKALESLPPEQQVEIVKELVGNIPKCVKDQNGNHVVQKCIECVDPAQLQFIIDSFRGQVLQLSTHPYGCRVIQRILEHCTEEQVQVVLDEVHAHIGDMVMDQYGNYVIQHILEHGKPESKSKIVNEIRGKVLPLSQHKFASNVVEKCVSHSSRAERSMLIEEVCAMSDGPQSALFTMMKDQFANYVIQKMIDVADPTHRKMLLQRIRPHVNALRKYTYGKHILTKLEKCFAKSNDLGGPMGLSLNGPL